MMLEFYWSKDMEMKVIGDTILIIYCHFLKMTDI